MRFRRPVVDLQVPVALGLISILDLDVEVCAIRRRGIRGGDPSPDTQLESGDILVLKGQPDALSLAEAIILGRKSMGR